MIQTEVYIDCVDRWCLGKDAMKYMSEDRVSDNGVYITIATKTGEINDLNDKIIDIINQPNW